MITVVGNIHSRAFRVLWMLEELGEPYEHIPAMPQAKEVLKYNPSGKIPVLVEDGEPVTDSTAIIQYLADRSDRFTYPAGTKERARQDSWTNMLLDEFDACLWAAAKHSFVLPKPKRVQGLKETLRWEFKRSVDLLAARMGNGPYLMGGEFTVPDIILAHCGHWAEVAKFEIAQPALTKYLETVRDRPGYKRTAQARRR